MEKKVKISLNNGTEKFLADLTKEDLENVKLTEKDGKTNLTLKSEIVNEDDVHKFERRLYKWTTMSKLAMYELSIPKTLDTFVKEKGKDVVYEYAIGNYAIEQDKVNNGISNGISKEAKATAKAIDKGSKEMQSEIQAILEKYNVKTTVEQAKKNMKSRGFGK